MPTFPHLPPPTLPGPRAAKSFEELGLSQELLQGLYTEMKFERPSRIQAQTLPMILTPPFRSLIAQVGGPGAVCGREWAGLCWAGSAGQCARGSFPPLLLAPASQASPPSHPSCLPHPRPT